MTKETSGHNQEGDKAAMEAALWAKAEELSQERSALEKRTSELYDRAEILRKKPGLDALEELRDLEGEYFEAENEVRAIRVKENELQAALETLSAGMLSLSEFQTIVPPKQSDHEKLSKRRLAILREQERQQNIERANGGTPFEYYANHSDFRGGSRGEPTRLTTGRNKGHVKYAGDKLSAPEEFFHQTADTHGGKVPHGKKGTSYVSANGRKVRKK